MLRLMQGLFTGTVTAASTLVATGTPDKRLTSSLGFLGSSTFIGLTIGPAVGGLLAESFGYRMSFFLGAGVLLVGLLLVIFIVQEPEHAPDPDEVSGTKQRVGFWKGVTDLVTHLTPAIGFLMLILFLSRMGRSMLPPFLPLYIQELHGKKEGVAAIVGILSASGAFAAALAGILAGRLAERIDPLKLVAGFSVGAMLFSSWLFRITDIPLFTGVFALAVFGVGGIQPVVTGVMIRSIPPHRRGVFIGFQSMVASIAWMLSPILGSLIALHFGNRGVVAARPFFDGAVLCLALFLIVLQSRRRR
jgi:DHA1 family multidrug resistance protein-like MFS transporter